MAVETYDIQVASVTAGPVPTTIVMPGAGSLDKIILTAGTAPTAALQLDVLVNGVSALGTQIGFVGGVGSSGQNQPSRDISATDTRFSVQVPGTGQNQGIATGAVLLIDSEQLLVTGAEQGSNIAPDLGQGFDVSVPVQRGYNGTTAAAHTHGTPVFSGKPQLNANATFNTGPGLASPIAVPAGAVISFAITGGTGGANVDIQVITTVN